jgi:uncharacterized protein YkwD
MPRLFRWPPSWWPWQPVDPPAPPPPLPTPPPPPQPPQPQGGEINQLLTLHNEFRRAHGVAPLVLNMHLIDSASREALDCARSGRLNHTSSDGKNPFQRMQEAGYHYTWAGENIAEGQVDAVQACGDWENDPPHRQNMLNPQFRDVGFGVARSGNATYWAADFGSTVAALGATAAGAGRSGAFESYLTPTCAVAYRPSEAE